MDFIKNFISDYGAEILSTIALGIATYVGYFLKAIVQEFVNNKKIKEIVKTAVAAVEQMYKNLHGQEKFEAALAAATEMLNNKGLIISQIELRLLIEATLAEFNNAFNKEVASNKKDNTEEVEKEEKENEELENLSETGEVG